MLVKLRSHAIQLVLVSLVCAWFIVLLGLLLSTSVKTQPDERAAGGRTRPTFLPRTVNWDGKFPNWSDDGSRIDSAKKPRGKYKTTTQIYPDSLVDADEKFTVVMQTFNRTDLMLRLLNHYSGMRHLDKILVVWNNVDELPPVELWTSLEPHPVPVLFLPQSENKIQNRLQAFPQIKTEAVFLVDDDMMVSAQDMQFAFRVWKRFPHLLVGFTPRKHVKTRDGIFIYGNFELDSGTEIGSYVYSMVLTNAAFLHSKYLMMFNSKAVPASVHQLIDEEQNCEDIAINVMIGRHLARVDRPQCSALFVQPRDVRNLEKFAISGYRGLWHDPVHFLVRSYCLNKLAHIYNGLSLVYSNLAAIPYQ